MYLTTDFFFLQTFSQGRLMSKGSYNQRLTGTRRERKYKITVQQIFHFKTGKKTTTLTSSHGHKTASTQKNQLKKCFYRVQNNSESKNMLQLSLRGWLGIYQRNSSNQRCLCCSTLCGFNLSHTFSICVNAQALCPSQATVRHHTLTQTQ